MPVRIYPAINFPEVRKTETTIVPVESTRRSVALVSEKSTSTGFEPSATPDIPEVEEIGPFPIGGPAYRTVSPGIPITPSMHFLDPMEYSETRNQWVARYNPQTWREQYHLQQQLGRYNATYRWRHMTFAKSIDAHTVSDADYTPRELLDSGYEYPIEYEPGTNKPYGTHAPFRNSLVYQFRGTTTYLNPEKDEEKDHIMKYGLESADRIVHPDTSGVVRSTDENNAAQLTPTSPLHPFMRSYPDRARAAIVTAYNRTKVPVIDIEHRKAFRHIFITRPECYLMSGIDQPCLQAMNDEDMNTCWFRMPHVLRALSPVYVVQCASVPHYANWNFLLSNRVQGMTTGPNTLTVLDNMTKTDDGATLVMGKNMTTPYAGQLELSFLDTKYMDVYEMLRIWMIYIHKRAKGKFFPPFNGYQYENGFYGPGGAASGKNAGGYGLLHPYDRAIEYCASIYDIVTNEAGDKILYWCKYYGVFPTNVSNGMLSNQKNGPLNGEATISATFQYQYKRENVFKNLVEFNYNAGLVDSVGKVREDAAAYLRNSVPFLYREKGQGGTSYTNPNITNYVGAASMFTGSPYIITEVSGNYDPWRWGSGSKLVQAKLGFIPLFYGQNDINQAMNLGITNEEVPSAKARQALVLQY